jgi:transposase
MQAITTIGLDIAKSVFQVHGVDAECNVIHRCQIKRRYVPAFFQKLSPCVVGIKACASSHHWSRELPRSVQMCCQMSRASPSPYRATRRVAGMGSVSPGMYPSRSSTGSTGKSMPVSPIRN